MFPSQLSRSSAIRLLLILACTSLASEARAQGQERVGWEAQLSTLAHGVSGTVRIVDEFTLEVEHFSYDGGGISVYFWLDDPAFQGEGVDYENGVPVGSDLVQMGFVDADLLIDTGDVSLDGHDGISVWCVAAGVSFGDGIFVPLPEPGAVSLQSAGLGTLGALLTLRRRRRWRR